MADFPSTPFETPDEVANFPRMADGYAELCSEVEIEYDDEGDTNPNLHRRIDTSLNLYTHTITIVGVPIVEDDLGNLISMPLITDIKDELSTNVLNYYDSVIINLGQYVSDYITSFGADQTLVTFRWVIRTTQPEFDTAIELPALIDRIYRLDPIVLEDTYSVDIDSEHKYSPDTYSLMIGGVNSYRTTTHYYYDDENDTEIP